MVETIQKNSGIFETGLSYLSVPGPPLSPLTLGQLLDEAARKWGNYECFYDVPMNTRLSFDQLKNQVDLMASGLLKMGMNKGDRIGIWGANGHRWIITFLAAAKVGIIIVPLNVGFEAPELLYALNYLSVKCLVLAEPVKNRDFYKILNDAIPDMNISEENQGNGVPILSSILAPHLKTIVYMGNERLKATRLWSEIQLMGKMDQDLENMSRVAADVQCDDILHIPFTSGTTGRPKGAMISHHAHVNSIFQLGNRLGLTQKDRNCQVFPLFPLYGTVIAMVTLGFGCSVVIPSPTVSPVAAITAVAKERCTWIQATPTMYSDMLNAPGFDLLDLSSLTGVLVGAARAPKKLLFEMKQKLGISRLTVGYGTTEGNCLSAGRVDDPLDLASTGVGYPHDNTETKIIDIDGRIVSVGETGEICSRTFGLMRGYWEDPEKTKEVIDPAGWYHTGDAGYFLESGHLVLAGRFNDMINRGGEKLYPKEIEDFLYQNLDVEEVHVFGVFDERLGEAIAAWILLKETSTLTSAVTMDADQIKTVCEGKISRSKIPKFIKFVQSKDDFPWSPLRKVMKKVMQLQYEKELGLKKQE